MDIVCRHCNATYTIADHKIPAQKASARCKRCGNRIVITPPAATEPPPPAPARGPAKPEPIGPTRRHEEGVIDAFPELTNFSPASYALCEILKPNRKGSYRTRLNKLKVKILTASKPKLDRLVKADEQVMRIAAGTAYYPVEIFFGNGFLTMLYNRYAVVATNRRLVMVNTNHRMTRAGHYVFQMAYGEIRKVSCGLFRTCLDLKRKKGKRRIFNSMKMAFTAELRDFIKPRMTSEKTTPQGDGLSENLCPACYTGLPAKLSQCPACQAAFKTPRKASLRSLLLPGWGDWYLGHRFLGGLELLGSLIVWSIVLSLMAEGGLENTAVAAVLLVFYNGFDALLTRHMARKGYMLEARQPVEAVQTGLAASHA